MTRTHLFTAESDISRSGSHQGARSINGPPIYYYNAEVIYTRTTKGRMCLIHYQRRLEASTTSWHPMTTSVGKEK